MRLWLLAFALLVGGFIATIAALNGDVYSAHGFVRGYLDALSAKNSAAALEVPGVASTTGSVETLLTDGAMGELDNIALVRETEGANGTRTVVYDYEIGGQSGRSEFTVVQTGTRFGLFPTWRFSASPLATVAVDVLGDDRFEANGFDVATPGAYLVFAPGLYELDLETTYLTAEDVPVAVTDPGTIVDATLALEPTDAFVAAVKTETDAYLDDCATQKVLQPTGCPFGATINNRVEGDPAWSIADYPATELVATETNGVWLVPETTATAHLTASVRSLFDGTLSEFDDDVPFVLGFTVTLDGDTISIAAR
jgi:hypothetical protein